MRVVFAGTPEVAVPALRRLLDSEHTVVGVLTRPDAPAGRGRRLVPSPIRVLAQEAGLPVFTPSSLREPAAGEILGELAPDCCPVVAYGNLVPPALLDLPQHGWINLHFSLLPAWRGAAPVQHAIIGGDEVTGASVFRLEAGLDTGPVFASRTEPIRASDTSGDLLGRLADSGADLLASTLDELAAGRAVPVPQSDRGVSLAPKIEVDDARVQWYRPAAEIDRLIRGCTPAPGAWTTFRGERVKLDPVRTSLPSAAGAQQSDDAGAPPAAPGTLEVTSRRVRVRAGDGWVELGRLRAAGKKPMAAADWARGTRPETDEAFQ